MDKNQNLTQLNNYNLVPTNLSVIMLAKRFKWKPETAVRRIQNALPTTLEQQIYIAIAKDFGILPESLAKILRIYLGYQNLQLEDLNPRQVDKNITYSKFINFSEFLAGCLNLLKVVSQEYTGLSLTINQAAYIVLNYGTDNSELLLDMVATNLDELCQFFELDYHSDSKKLSICLWLILNKIIPYNKSIGQVDTLDPTTFLESGFHRRQSLRFTLSEELPDYLALDAYELGTQCELLKKEGVI